MQIHNLVNLYSHKINNVGAYAVLDKNIDCIGAISGSTESFYI